MSYIFVDESGDLGFDWSKEATSKNFIVTFMFCNKYRPISKILTRTYTNLPKSIKKSHSGIFHCSKEKPKIRYQVLRNLAEQDVSILSIYLNKRKVYTRLQDEKQVLYNYVTNILLDRIYSKKIVPANVPIQLIASRRETSKYLNQNFKNYLEKQVKNNHSLDLRVEIMPHGNHQCLQVVDFVSWSLFRHREHGDDSYYNVIKSRIIEENPLYP